MEETNEKIRLSGREKAIAVMGLILAAAGVFLLYPIGSSPANRIFLIVKACMMAGLLMFLLSERQETGLKLWAYASVLACACTIYKWVDSTGVSGGMIALYIGSLMVDLVLPISLWRMYLKDVMEKKHE